MSTLAQLRTRVYYEIRDTDQQLVVPAAVNAYLNQAQRDLARRLKLNQAEVSSTTSDNTIEIPTDALVVTKLRVNSADVRVVDDEEWDSYSDSFDVPDETLARVFNGQIEVYPTPAANTAYVLRYVKRPTDLAADADVSVLPEEAQDKMVYYAASRALWVDGQSSEGDKFMELYEADLPRGTFTGKLAAPGPLRLRYEPNNFDLSGTHRG